jgi:hypothetical protein
MKNVLLSKLTKLALVSSLLFFACSTKASAEVNMKVLNSVIKSCQDNPPKDNSLFGIAENTPQSCVELRYHYTLFMSKYNGLKNLGELRPGFPSSLLIFGFREKSSKEFLDCMVSQDSSSSECGELNRSNNYYDLYLVYNIARVCSSYFEAYVNAGNNFRESMTKDLITWFYALDKPNRKLVVDSLSNSDFTDASVNEAREASQLYLKIKEKVERDTQEQKRRELLQ